MAQSKRLKQQNIRFVGSVTALLVAITLCSPAASAQERLQAEVTSSGEGSTTEAFPANEPYPEPKGVKAYKYNWMSSKELFLSVLVILTGCLVILAEYQLLARVQNLEAMDLVKIFSVTLIIIGALFIVTAGFSNDQVAPAFGLLGTIAGYLLGRGQGIRDVRRDDVRLE